MALAASRGHGHLISSLLATGLSLEGKGTTDRTPLMQAAFNGHLQTIKALLNLGADPLATTNEGVTALHLAAQEGHHLCVAALVPVTPRNKTRPHGITPVHLASHNGHENVVEVLRDAGWSLTAWDRCGRTPLHYAAAGGSLDLIEFLVQRNGDPGEKDNDGLTPLDVAVHHGQHAVKEWLAGKGVSKGLSKTMQILLAENGAKSCNEWLSLMEDVQVNRTILEHVAKQVRNFPLEFETVQITDNNVTNATALLPLIPRKNVRVELKTKEIDLGDLRRALANHSCTWLVLWQHYKEPNVQPASDSLLRAIPRSHLEDFMGHLSPDCITLLNECRHLKYLGLAVSGDHDAPAILSALAQTLPSLPLLRYFFLHIPVAAVTTDLLGPIICFPDSVGQFCVLPDVDETNIDKAVKVAVRFQSRVNGPIGLSFPRTKLKVDTWKYFLNKLADAGMITELGIRASDINDFTENDETELNNLARARNLGSFKRFPDDELWLPT